MISPSFSRVIKALTKLSAKTHWPGGSGMLYRAGVDTLIIQCAQHALCQYLGSSGQWPTS